jgi:hypothetical protein
MPYVPFSQRTGLEPIPPQLKLGEASGELRRLLDYYISLEIGRGSDTYNGRGFTDIWRRVATDLHVMFFKQRIDKFDYNVTGNAERLKALIQRANIGELFDLIEFLVRHPGCSDELKRELADAFVRARAAYRVFDNKYCGHRHGGAGGSVRARYRGRGGQECHRRTQAAHRRGRGASQFGLGGERAREHPRCRGDGGAPRTGQKYPRCGVKHAGASGPFARQA